jgi:hypothetical protein
MRSLTIALALMLGTSPALAERCLDMKDARETHFTSNLVMTVETKDRRHYTVTFREGCAVHRFPLTWFVYEQWTLQCVGRGDVMPTNDKGPCFVQSVQQTS